MDRQPFDQGRACVQGVGGFLVVVEDEVTRPALALLLANQAVVRTLPLAIRRGQNHILNNDRFLRRRVDQIALQLDQCDASVFVGDQSAHLALNVAVVVFRRDANVIEFSARDLHDIGADDFAFVHDRAQRVIQIDVFRRPRDEHRYFPKFPAVLGVVADDHFVHFLDATNPKSVLQRLDVTARHVAAEIVLPVKV